MFELNPGQKPTLEEPSYSFEVPCAWDDETPSRSKNQYNANHSSRLNYLQTKNNYKILNPIKAKKKSKRYEMELD